MAERIQYSFAISGDRDTVPQTPTGTEVSFQVGWTSAYELEDTDPGFRYVDRTQHNYLWYAVTSNIKEWQEQMKPAFYSDIDYSIGAVSIFSGVEYQRVSGSGAVADPSVSSDFVPYQPQFEHYQEGRVYQLGDVCYTIDPITGGKVFWEWYSNQESLANIDPTDPANRQPGWASTTTPFYWTPYKRARAGTVLWPWLSNTFPEGTINIAGNSVPAAVYWRIAAAFPEYVSGENVVFPQMGGEFFRVLDGGRGVDVGRTFGSNQSDEFKSHKHTASDASAEGSVDGLWFYANKGSGGVVSTNSTNETGGDETRPRNLAFPIIVEI